MYRVLFWMLFLLSFKIAALSPNTFYQSKKIAETLFSSHEQTLYCQCPYANKSVNLIACGMQSALEKQRAHRIEWDHILAAEHFGQHFECWRTTLCQDHQGHWFKGRKCCQKINSNFRHLEAELYNLWPVVGLVNQARSNYRFGQLETPHKYYGCDIRIDKQLRLVEPADLAKGIVARANLFMAYHYKLPMSKSQRHLFQAWNKLYPPSSWEKQWALKVSHIEGYDNPFITQWSTSTG